MDKYTKLKIATRYRLLGMSQVDPRWLNALSAFDFAEQYHTGTRKDGKTPEFMHQLQIISFLLPHIRFMNDPVGVIVAAFLHDTREDYDIDSEKIERLFGERASIDIECLTKKFRNIKKNAEEYYTPLASNYNSSLVKGADRINNLSTMIGAFSKEKQIAYCAETRVWFFSFLKEARRNFPSQEPIYESIKFALEIQLNIYEEMNKE